MPLIVSKKDAKKYGATLDSAGNYSVGGKDPSSSSGRSGTRYGATGYVSPTRSDVSTIKAPKKTPTTASVSSAGSIPSWVTSGHELIDGKWVYTRPLSAQGQQNVSNEVARSMQISAPVQGPTQVQGPASSINNPMHGTNAWQTVNPYTGMLNIAGTGNMLGSRSSIPAANAAPTALSSFGQAVGNWFNRPVQSPDWTSIGFQNGQLGVKSETVPASRVGFEMATTLAPEAKLFGSWGAQVWKGLNTAARNALARLGVKNATQLESVVNLRKGTAPTRATGVPTNRATQFADNAVYAGTRKSTGTVFDAVTDIIRRGTVPLGGVATAETVGAMNAPQPVTQPVQVGVVRNAVPAGAATTTDTASVSRTTGGATPLASSYSPTSLASTSTGGASSVTGGGAGGSYGGATGMSGTMGATALRGEQLTEEQAAAQARAMELQRQSAGGAGVGVTPIGEQVDIANLQALRDKAKQMLDQYGTEASTMPEFKSTVQAMLAAGIANINKIQPTPPEPVVETQEQADFLSQFEDTERVDVMGQMDQWRRDLGITEIEKQKIDVQKQLQAVNEVYQRVIDDIKANPNLPKGLAGRRLTEIFQDQKFAASSLIAQLDMLDEQLTNANTRLNQNMGILEMQMNQEEKQKQRRMDQLGMMIDSGAIGGMSDRELSQWSDVTGIPTSALQNMRERALDVEKDYKTEYFTDDAGNVTAITKDMNDPLSEDIIESFGRVGRATNFGNAGGGTTTADSGDVDTWANLLLNDPDNFKISNVPDKLRTAVVGRYNEMLNAPPTDDELQSIFQGYMEDNMSFEQVLDEIDSNPLIVNKAAAGHIAAGIYNETQDSQTSGGAISGFFSRLFGN